MRTALGAPEQQLVKLRRVTLGSLLNLSLLALAAYTLIAAFGDVDLESFVQALRDASWWWLAFALVLAQIPRFPAAVSTMGSLAHPLPFGPLAALQFAICYVNLAIPSTAARVAINVRFFQRLGITPATAMTAGAIDSVAGFVVQITIFLVLFFGSDLDLGLSNDLSETSGLATVVLIVVGVVIAAVVVVIAVAPLRRRVLSLLRQASAALRVLRSPSKLAQLFGGNVLSQVLFAVAFAAVVEAFGFHLPLSQLLLINTVVSLFAGLLPIPGGIGVSEAGLTLGLTTAGVPSDTALAMALAYRMVSFYLPADLGVAVLPLARQAALPLSGSSPRHATGAATVLGAELGGEELECRLRLGVLLALGGDALGGEELLHLHGDIDALPGEALRGELDDARAVRVEPHLGDDAPPERLRRELQLEHEDRAQDGELVEGQPRWGVLGEERALVLREQLAQRSSTARRLADRGRRQLTLERPRAHVPTRQRVELDDEVGQPAQLGREVRRHDRAQLDHRVVVATLDPSRSRHDAGAVEVEVGRVEEEHLAQSGPRAGRRRAARPPSARSRPAASASARCCRHRARARERGGARR